MNPQGRSSKPAEHRELNSRTLRLRSRTAALTPTFDYARAVLLPAPRLFVVALALLLSACPAAAAPDAGTPGLCLEGRVPRPTATAASRSLLHPTRAGPHHARARLGGVPTRRMDHLPPGLRGRSPPGGAAPTWCPSATARRAPSPRSAAAPCSPSGGPPATAGFTPDPSGWGCDASSPRPARARPSSARLSACVSVATAARLPSRRGHALRRPGPLDRGRHALPLPLGGGGRGTPRRDRGGGFRALRRGARLRSRCASSAAAPSAWCSRATAAPPRASVVTSTDAVEVRGLSVVGHRGGAVVEAAAAHPRGAAARRQPREGPYASGAGSRITASRARFADARDRERRPGQGAVAYLGAQVALTDCAWSATAPWPPSRAAPGAG